MYSWKYSYIKCFFAPKFCVTIETISINMVWNNWGNSAARALCQRILPKLRLQGLGLQDFAIPIYTCVYTGRERKRFFMLCSAKESRGCPGRGLMVFSCCEGLRNMLAEARQVLHWKDRAGSWGWEWWTWLRCRRDLKVWESRWTCLCLSPHWQNWG